MQFIDEVTIEVRAGDGGKGCVSFRREKYVPRGGPNGGDGGNGGSVYIQTDSGLSTLLDLKYKSRFCAGRGGHGGGKDKHGKNGGDVIVRVPEGTVVRDAQTQNVLADLVDSSQSYLAAQGGLGGRGNHAFVSSTHQAPKHAEDGRPGEARTLTLELKLLADVGLVGRPNAGKSTLISKVSAAKPKIADYPFTTTIPQLGVVRVGNFQSFTMADIPGLIEGAHEGAGMGIRFLKHIERTGLFLHLIDLNDPEHGDPWESYQKIEKELLLYKKDFDQKTKWVVLTKIDLLKDSNQIKKALDIFTKSKIRTFTISAVTGEGVDQLVYALGEEISRLK